MKTLKHLVLFLAAALVATSCSNDENEPNTPTKEGKPVKFEMTIAGANTRTVTDASSRTTTWKNGDAVGIFVYEESSLVYTNVKYQYDGTEWKCESNGITTESGKTYKYYAYYPYQEGITSPTSVSLSAIQDQNSDSNYDLSDVLAAKNENGAIDNTNNLVTLTFQHMYAMVEVSLFGDKVTKDPSAVKLMNVKLGGTLNLETESVTNSGDATEITMKYLGLQKEARAYRAVVPAQTITTGTPLVAVYDVDDAGKDYQFTYSKDVPYIKGEYRIMEVKIGEANSGITIPSKNTTIDPWTPSTSLDGTGSYEEIVVKLIQEPKNVTLIKATFAEMKNAEGWYKFIRGTGDEAVTEQSIIDISSDNNAEWNKALQLKYTSVWDPAADSGKGKAVNNSYYISLLTYQHIEPLDNSNTSIYKLTFKAKSVKNELGVRSKVMVACSTGMDHYFNLYTGTNHTTTGTATGVTFSPDDNDNWQELTLYINLNKKGTSFGTANVATTADDLAMFCLRFYTNSAATKDITSVTGSYDICDVKLEPFTVPVD